MLNPPSPHNANVLQMNERVQELQEELARVQQQASIDIQNLQNEKIGDLRTITRLRNELSDVINEDSPEAEDVKALLDLWWREVKGADKKVKHDLKSTRAPQVKKALKRRGKEMCRKAVLGIRYDDWAMGRLRKSQGHSFNCIAKHILCDDDAIEKWAKLYDRHNKPMTLLDDPASEAVPKPELVVVPDQPDEIVKVDGASFNYTVYEKAKARRRPRDLAPIDVVLGALEARGCEWRRGGQDQWQAQCPSHEDNSPSLGVMRNPDGMIVMNCLAGCFIEDVISDLGLEWGDLYEDSHLDYQREQVLTDKTGGGPARRTELHDTLRMIEGKLRQWDREGRGAA